MAKARFIPAFVCAATVFVALCVCPDSVSAAPSAGTIRGVITGPDGKPMGGVPVQLRNDISGFKADTVTGRDGTYQFFGVPFNPYELHVEVQGFSPVHRDVDVRTTAPREVNVALELPAATASVTVQGKEPTAAQLETDTSMSHVDIDKSYIERVPATVSSRAMEQIVTSTPGFSKDENGRFHFQGAHSQSEYVIDGQTISDQTGATFSNSIDPGIAEGIEVIYGNVPAEFGEKIGAVINLTTKSSLGRAFHGEVYGGGGQFSTWETGASAGGGNDTFGAFGSVNASSSHYFLDPVNFDNLHNQGDTQRLFLRFDTATPGLSNSLRVTALLGRTDRDVPNTFSQQDAGQDQTVKTHDQNYNIGWQSVLSASSVLDVSGFARIAKYTLYQSPGDTPVLVDSNRGLNNYGVSPSFTWAQGIHEVKVGGTYKSFPIDEFFRFGITDPAYNDPASDGYNPNLAPYDLTRGGSPFEFRDKRTGTYWALYAQDNIHWNNLTLNLGVRYDHNNLPVTDVQIEPRLGIAYYVPRTGTVIRGSYNRVVYTPEYENILLSSSADAAMLVPPEIQDSRPLGGGVLPVHSERQDAWTAGIEQAVGTKVRVAFDYWQRNSVFTGDQDQFFNTGIVFPLAFTSGHLSGWNARLDLAEWNGLRGFASFGHVHAVYVNPPAGGLFLGTDALDSLAGGPFLIDHDQNLQIQGALTWDVLKTGAWVGVNVRYDSGLVTDADPDSLLQDPDNFFAAPYVVVHSGTDLDPNRIKPRTITDFSVGYNFAHVGVPVTLQANLLNAFDVKGMYNILSVFGGTHVVPPRTWSVRARVDF